MILHQERIDKSFRIEIVKGDDIMLSYKNNSKVSSCQSNDGRWRRCKFYSHIPALSLFRIMRGKVLMLRALLWEAKRVDGLGTVRLMDKKYSTAYPYDYCPGQFKVPSHPDIDEMFTANWQRFADQRSSACQLMVDVEPYEGEYPCVDTFNYLSKEKDRLSTYHYTVYQNWWRLIDHVDGTLK